MRSSNERNTASRDAIIGMAGDAKKLFNSWRDRNARDVADLADDHLRTHCSKLRGACARIALLFSCTEVAGGKNVSAVSSDSIQRAIDVTKWLMAESVRI